jgi:hypothetical protein
MNESGWSGSSCGSVIDECLRSPFFDEAGYRFLRDSVVGPWSGDFGSPWTNAAVATMDWLSRTAGGISESDTPEFVFAHVVAPHPPFYLDANCEMTPNSERAGQGFHEVGVSDAEREEFLREQMSCVDGFVLDLASEIDPNDVVIFVGDHGTDRRHQADASSVNWSHEAIVERMNVFLAAQLPDGCSLGDPVITSNLLRTVLGCLSGEGLEMNEPRMWINPMDELSPDVVSDLLAMTPPGT